MAASRNPSSLHAPLIDSQREVVEIPDSQTTEQIPQVVHRTRLSKRGGRPGPGEIILGNRGTRPVERDPAPLQASIRSMAPSGIPALTTGHAATHSWHRVQASSSSIWIGENQRDWILENVSSFSLIPPSSREQGERDGDDMPELCPRDHHDKKEEYHIDVP